MIKSLLMIVLPGIAAFYFTDLGSDSLLRGVLLPVIDLFVLIALALWFVAMFHKHGVKQTGLDRGTDSATFIGGDGSGGDCG